MSTFLCYFFYSSTFFLICSWIQCSTRISVRFFNCWLEKNFTLQRNVEQNHSITFQADVFLFKFDHISIDVDEFINRCPTIDAWKLKRIFLCQTVFFLFLFCTVSDARQIAWLFDGKIVWEIIEDQNVQSNLNIWHQAFEFKTSVQNGWPYRVLNLSISK